MNLEMLIAKLQELVKENPKFKNYAIRFRGENQQEEITHFHTEGRTFILSNVWALDALNPASPDYKKMKNKVKQFKVEDQVN